MTLVDHDERVADVATIRAQFPALERVEAGHPVAYFDGPGGTQVPRCVVDAMNDYLFHRNANTHWNYTTSRETDESLIAARRAFADFLHADASEVAFGANMTTLTMHVARALGAAWDEGDEIVVTDLDHQANVAPWKRLAQERGVTIRTVPMLADSGTLDFDALASAIGRRTRLVAVNAASNAIGTVTDIAAVAEVARESGALTYVDAVHYASHLLVDVDAFGCDLLACSPYKFYGPHTGVLWGKHDLLASLDVPRLPPASNESPERMETGTLNHEGIVGAAAAVDFLASLAGEKGTRRERLVRTFGALHARGDELLTRAWTGLEAIPGVRLYGPRPGEPRTSTLGFRVEGHRSDEVAARLSDEFGIFVSDGDFYATTVVSSLGLPPDGLIRVGCACYTTPGEIDRLIEAVGTLA